MKKEHLNNIPDELKALDQWVLYGREKIPLTRNTGGAASTTDPKTWMPFDLAAECIYDLSIYSGIGFVFTADDPYVGIDLDNVINNQPNLPTDVAKHIEQIESTLWPYAYREISPSGNGIHYFVKGDLSSIQWTNTKWIEVYDQGRFFTMTGDEGTGTIMNAQPQLKALFHTPLPRMPKRRMIKSNTTLAQLINQWNVPVYEERQVKMMGKECTGYTVQCPWQDGHSTKNRQRDAIIAEDNEGRRYFHCFHASCSGRHWRDFKALYDPQTKEVAHKVLSNPNHDWIGDLM